MQLKNKKRANPIPKTLRPKKRYWVIAFFSNYPLQGQTVFESVRMVFLSLFGSVGVAKQKLVLRFFEPSTNCLVVQANLSEEKQVALGLAGIQSVGNQSVTSKVVLKTGSLQKALDKAKARR